MFAGTDGENKKVAESPKIVSEFGAITMSSCDAPFLETKWTIQHPNL